MRAERYRQIMKQMGMENSISVMLGLEQVANEVEQEVRKEFGDRKTIVPLIEKIEFWKEKYIKLAELCASSKLENGGLMKKKPKMSVKCECGCLWSIDDLDKCPMCGKK